MRVNQPAIPLPELGRKLKEEYFRSLPRPFSGRGPATVSSQSWSRSPMVAAHVRKKKGDTQVSKKKKRSLKLSLSKIPENRGVSLESRRYLTAKGGVKGRISSESRGDLDRRMDLMAVLRTWEVDR